MSGCSIFDEIIDEALAVIHEDFSGFVNECKDAEDITLRIREELRNSRPDFIKIVALCLTGEVLIGK